MNNIEQFYKWWTEIVKGNTITDEEMEIIIDKFI